jgi:hypothetical protein
MRYLTGKFVLQQGPESYRTGQIVKATRRAVLIQYDQMDKNPDPNLVMPMELTCCEELAHAELEFGKVWLLFDSRETLVAYLNWLNAPRDTKQVVKLVPKLH